MVSSLPRLTIDPGSGESLARQLTRELRSAIVMLRIMPGELLSEQDIASRLGVSRAPVREALIHLRDEGLIRVLPQRGTLVRKISPSAIEGVRFIREALERAVAREAARQAGPERLAPLRDTLAAQRRTDAPDAFFALDDSFHRQLADAAGRPEVWRLIEDVKPPMDRVRYLSMGEPIPRDTIIAHHASILDTVSAGDEAGADAAMQLHLSAIIHSLPRLAARHAGLFEPE